MKKICATLLTVGSVVLLFACTNVVTGSKNESSPRGLTAPETGPVLAQHPPLSAQDELRPCVACHEEVTPEIYTQWYNSGHGIGFVKCYECHGTYEQMYKVPPMDRCAVCHAGETMKNPSAKPCWECHLDHTFKGH